MESVKEKIKELAEWVYENGYPMEKIQKHEDSRHYRLDDRFFRYDLYNIDGKPSMLIVGIPASEKKFPLFAAVYKEGNFNFILSGKEIADIHFRRRK